MRDRTVPHGFSTVRYDTDTDTNTLGTAARHGTVQNGGNVNISSQMSGYHISVSFKISRRFAEFFVLLRNHLEQVHLYQVLAVVGDQVTTSASMQGKTIIVACCRNPLNRRPRLTLWVREVRKNCIDRCGSRVD